MNTRRRSAGQTTGKAKPVAGHRRSLAGNNATEVLVSHSARKKPTTSQASAEVIASNTFSISASNAPMTLPPADSTVVDAPTSCRQPQIPDLRSSLAIEMKTSPNVTCIIATPVSCPGVYFKPSTRSKNSIILPMKMENSSGKRKNKSLHGDEHETIKSVLNSSELSPSAGDCFPTTTAVLKASTPASLVDTESGPDELPERSVVCRQIELRLDKLKMSTDESACSNHEYSISSLYKSENSEAVECDGIQLLSTAGHSENNIHHNGCVDDLGTGVPRAPCTRNALDANDIITTDSGSEVDSLKVISHASDSSHCASNQVECFNKLMIFLRSCPTSKASEQRNSTSEEGVVDSLACKESSDIGKEMQECESESDMLALKKELSNSLSELSNFIEQKKIANGTQSASRSILNTCNIDDPLDNSSLISSDDIPAVVSYFDSNLAVSNLESNAVAINISSSPLSDCRSVCDTGTGSIDGPLDNVCGISFSDIPAIVSDMASNLVVSNFESNVAALSIPSPSSDCNRNCISEVPEPFIKAELNDDAEFASSQPTCVLNENPDTLESSETNVGNTDKSLQLKLNARRLFAMSLQKAVASATGTASLGHAIEHHPVVAVRGTLVIKKEPSGTQNDEICLTSGKDLTVSASEFCSSVNVGVGISSGAAKTNRKRMSNAVSEDSYIVNTAKKKRMMLVANGSSPRVDVTISSPQKNDSALKTFMPKLNSVFESKLLDDYLVKYKQFEFQCLKAVDDDDYSYSFKQELGHVEEPKVVEMGFKEIHEMKEENKEVEDEAEFDEIDDIVFTSFKSLRSLNKYAAKLSSESSRLRKKCETVKQSMKKKQMQIDASTSASKCIAVSNGKIVDNLDLEISLDSPFVSNSQSLQQFEKKSKRNEKRFKELLCNGSVRPFSESQMKKLGFEIRDNRSENSEVYKAESYISSLPPPTLITRRGIGNMGEDERQPRKGKVYGRRYDGRYASQATVKYVVKKRSSPSNSLATISLSQISDASALDAAASSYHGTHVDGDGDVVKKEEVKECMDKYQIAALKPVIITSEVFDAVMATFTLDTTTPATVKDAGHYRKEIKAQVKSARVQSARCSIPGGTNDCFVTLPPLPLLSNLSRTVSSDQPQLLNSNTSNSTPPGCSKDFCSLGCICEGLKTPPKKQSLTASRAGRKRSHCGRYECMFQCSCTLPRLRPQSSVPISLLVSSMSRSIKDHVLEVTKEECKMKGGTSVNKGSSTGSFNSAVKGEDALSNLTKIGNHAGSKSCNTVVGKVRAMAKGVNVDTRKKVDPIGSKIFFHGNAWVYRDGSPKPRLADLSFDVPPKTSTMTTKFTKATSLTSFVADTTKTTSFTSLAADTPKTTSFTGLAAETPTITSFTHLTADAPITTSFTSLGADTTKTTSFTGLATDNIKTTSSTGLAADTGLVKLPSVEKLEEASSTVPHSTRPVTCAAADSGDIDITRKSSRLKGRPRMRNFGNLKSLIFYDPTIWLNDEKNFERSKRKAKKSDQHDIATTEPSVNDSNSNSSHTAPPSSVMEDHDFGKESTVEKLDRPKKQRKKDKLSSKRENLKNGRTVKPLKFHKVFGQTWMSWDAERDRSEFERFSRKIAAETEPRYEDDFSDAYTTCARTTVYTPVRRYKSKATVNTTQNSPAVSSSQSSVTVEQPASTAARPDAGSPTQPAFTVARPAAGCLTQPASIVACTLSTGCLMQPTYTEAHPGTGGTTQATSTVVCPGTGSLTISGNTNHSSMKGNSIAVKKVSSVQEKQTIAQKPNSQLNNSGSYVEQLLMCSVNTASVATNIVSQISVPAKASTSSINLPMTSLGEMSKQITQHSPSVVTTTVTQPAAAGQTGQTAVKKPAKRQVQLMLLQKNLPKDKEGGAETVVDEEPNPSNFHLLEIVSEGQWQSIQQRVLNEVSRLLSAEPEGDGCVGRVFTVKELTVKITQPKGRVTSVPPYVYGGKKPLDLPPIRIEITRSVVQKPIVENNSAPRLLLPRLPVQIGSSGSGYCKTLSGYYQERCGKLGMLNGKMPVRPNITPVAAMNIIGSSIVSGNSSGHLCGAVVPNTGGTNIGTQSGHCTVVSYVYKPSWDRNSSMQSLIPDSEMAEKDVPSIKTSCIDLTLSSDDASDNVAVEVMSTSSRVPGKSIHWSNSSSPAAPVNIGNNFSQAIDTASLKITKGPPKISANTSESVEEEFRDLVNFTEAAFTTSPPDGDSLKNITSPMNRIRKRDKTIKNKSMCTEPDTISSCPAGSMQNCASATILSRRHSEGDGVTISSSDPKDSSGGVPKQNVCNKVSTDNPNININEAATAKEKSAIITGAATLSVSTSREICEAESTMQVDLDCEIISENHTVKVKAGEVLNVAADVRNQESKGHDEIQAGKADVDTAEVLELSSKSRLNPSIKQLLQKRADGSHQEIQPTLCKLSEGSTSSPSSSNISPIFISPSPSTSFSQSPPSVLHSTLKLFPTAPRDVSTNCVSTIVSPSMLSNRNMALRPTISTATSCIPVTASPRLVKFGSTIIPVVNSNVSISNVAYSSSNTCSPQESTPVICFRPIPFSASPIPAGSSMTQSADSVQSSKIIYQPRSACSGSLHDIQRYVSVQIPNPPNSTTPGRPPGPPRMLNVRIAMPYRSFHRAPEPAALVNVATSGRNKWEAHRLGFVYNPRPGRAISENTSTGNYGRAVSGHSMAGTFPDLSPTRLIQSLIGPPTVTRQPIAMDRQRTGFGSGSAAVSTNSSGSCALNVSTTSVIEIDDSEEEIDTVKEVVDCDAVEMRPEKQDSHVNPSFQPDDEEVDIETVGRPGETSPENTADVLRKRCVQSAEAGGTGDGQGGHWDGVGPELPKKKRKQLHTELIEPQVDMEFNEERVRMGNDGEAKRQRRCASSLSTSSKETNIDDDDVNNLTKPDSGSHNSGKISHLVLIEPALRASPAQQLASAVEIADKVYCERVRRSEQSHRFKSLHRLVSQQYPLNKGEKISKIAILARTIEMVYALKTKHTALRNSLAKECSVRIALEKRIKAAGGRVPPRTEIINSDHEYVSTTKSTDVESISAS